MCPDRVLSKSMLKAQKVRLCSECVAHLLQQGQCCSLSVLMRGARRLGNCSADWATSASRLLQGKQSIYTTNIATLTFSGFLRKPVNLHRSAADKRVMVLPVPCYPPRNGFDVR